MSLQQANRITIMLCNYRVIQIKSPLLLIAALTGALALTRLTITVTSDVSGSSLAFLFIIDSIIVDSLAFVQRLEALLVDGGEVDEDVFRSILGGWWSRIPSRRKTWRFLDWPCLYFVVCVCFKFLLKKIVEIIYFVFSIFAIDFWYGWNLKLKNWKFQKNDETKTRVREERNV